MHHQFAVQRVSGATGRAVLRVTAMPIVATWTVQPVLGQQVALTVCGLARIVLAACTVRPSAG